MQAPKQPAGAPLAGPSAVTSVSSAAEACVGVLDLGSSAIKCMYSRAYEPDTLHLAARISTPTLESGLQSEFSPTLLDHAIEQAFVALAKATQGQNVIAIALTGQIGGVLLLDHHNNLISPSLTWADRRATDQAQLFAHTFEGRFESLLGHALPPQTCWSAPKIHRLTRQDAVTMAKVSCVMQLPDYAFYRMTRQRQSVSTIGISLVHQQQNRYAADMLHWAGICEDQLPTLPPTQAAGEPLSGTCASLWRKARSEPDDSTLPVVVLTGADMYCGLHGSGAIQNQAIIQAGTTEIAGVMAHHQHQPAQRGSVLRLKLPNSRTPSTRALDVIYGSTSNGGMSLSWLQQQHGLSLHDESLWAAAAVAHKDAITSTRSNVASKSLIFIPHIHGARAPLWRDDATGGFVEIDETNQDAPHMLLAVLQGCAMNKLAVLQAAGADLSHAAGQPVIVAGGGARQTLANQIRANVLGTQVIARNVTDVTAAGAIAIALDHLSHTRRPDQFAHTPGSDWLRQLHASTGSRTFEPEADARCYYQSLYKQYQLAEQAMLAGLS